MNLAPANDESLDCILGGAVQILQAKAGYRTAIDAPLLAWFAAQHAPFDARAVELGVGSGLVAIVFLLARPQAHVTAVEVQPQLVDRALRNAALNGVADRLCVVQGDLAAPPTFAAHFTAVLCNPPYLKRDHGHPPLQPERRIAHQESTATLRQFCHVAAGLVAVDAWTYWVFPFHDGQRLLDDLEAAGLGDRAILLVRHRPNDLKPNRILVRARLGEARLEQLPDRAIHPQDQPDRVFQPDLAAFFSDLHNPPPP